MTRENRRDPQALLEAVKKTEAQRQRGRLRVFLGMCPGVGKTFAMLKAAQEQLQRSLHVAVGVVETHGRKETANLLDGLKIYPKRQSTYKDSILYEMDIDAILAEKPQLILVDELAHTNAPGARHKKRYQDVEELLNAGIDVYTTLNIQHIESRNDQVAQITGVRVKETVPDSFLEKADQIELIDLSPNELLRRLADGKVYLGDRAEQAAQNFFKEEHLMALRELALRFTAEKVDQDLSTQMIVKGIEGPWNTNERLLVAISHSPYSARLIRTTRRMAYNLEAPWVALYIDTGEALPPEDQQMLQKNIALARELGAELLTFADTNLASAIQKVCRDRNVTQIIMGRPDRRFVRDLVTGGTLLDQLVRTTSKIDVHVIRSERVPKFRGFYFDWPKFKSGLVSYYNTAWFLFIVSCLSYSFLPHLGHQALGTVFLLAILVVSLLSTRGPILFAAIVSALVWDFFFIPPKFTFAISSSEDIMMLISFFIAALVAGFLTSKIRRQSEILEKREEKAVALYEFGKRISQAASELSILDILKPTIDRQFSIKSAALLTNREGKFVNTAPHMVSDNDFAVATWAFEHKTPAGWSTSTLSGSKCLCVPMNGKSGAVGVVLLYPDKHQKHFTLEDDSFLEAVNRQAAIAIERLRFGDAAQSAKILEASESLHQTLLNSISHEMRTPLTVILGSASWLDDDNVPKSPKDIKAVASELTQASDRLNRVVENLLDMNRLESGVLALKLDWYDLEDLIHTTIQKLGKNLASHKIVVNVAKNLPLVQIDVRLFEHALSNLLLNASSYSPIGTDIRISASTNETSKSVQIAIEDQGPGIPEASQNKIFEKFYRVPGTPAGGTGLGLSIVKSIVEFHKGTVEFQNHAAGGARFMVNLPLQKPPSAPKGAAL